MFKNSRSNISDKNANCIKQSRTVYKNTSWKLVNSGILYSSTQETVHFDKNATGVKRTKEKVCAARIHVVKLAFI